MICDKSVFFPGSPISSSNNTDRHDITEILLKVALNTISLINIWLSNCFTINVTDEDYSRKYVKYLRFCFHYIPVLSLWSVLMWEENRLSIKTEKVFRPAGSLY